MVDHDGLDGALRASNLSPSFCTAVENRSTGGVRRRRNGSVGERRTAARPPNPPAIALVPGRRHDVLDG